MKPSSLKALIPTLAKSFGMTPAAIYERQRVLVRAGLLQARPGHGPGSGVPADAKSVATLLISLLSTGSLSEIEEQTRLIANLKNTNGRCPVTGKRTFGAALTATLNSREFLSRALWAANKRSGKTFMASMMFFKKPINKISDVQKEDTSESHFGSTPYDFALKTFSPFTIEAHINLWGALRGVELQS
jgi:hypothetical protein